MAFGLGLIKICLHQLLFLAVCGKKRYCELYRKTYDQIPLSDFFLLCHLSSQPFDHNVRVPENIHTQCHWKFERGGTPPGGGGGNHLTHVWV